jgi:hypothetical protein
MPYRGDVTEADTREGILFARRKAPRRALSAFVDQDQRFLGESMARSGEPPLMLTSSGATGTRQPFGLRGYAVD